MNYDLHFGDCIKYMQGRPDNSVHFAVVDSPFWLTDLHFDKQPLDWNAFWLEMERVLTPNGVVVCFAAETFTLDLIASNRPWYRYRMIWAKTKASRYPDASWRPLCGHEDLVVFAPKIKSATYNPQMSAYDGPPKSTKRKTVKAKHYKAQRYAAEYKDDGTRYPTTILEFASVGTTAPHFNPTAKPVPLIQYLVLTYSNPGDVVFEPFAGDAPTARACFNTGRNYLGCEADLEQWQWSANFLQQTCGLFRFAPQPVAA